MTWQGVWTVARLELLQRARTSRWPVVFGLWFAVIAGVTTLSYLALNTRSIQAGPQLYDVTIFFVLGLAMLVVPSLTATSVNGDREQGVLATLQTTLLTPADIILGKLLSSWLVALAFLATAAPFLAWAFVAGGINAVQIVVSLVILALVVGVVCAVGLAFSTLTARPVASAVLTYLTMAVLVFGTTITFLLSAFLVQDKEQVRYFGVPDDYWSSQPAPTEENKATLEPTVSDCRHLTREGSVAHTERIWWLLPLNPFVVVADAVPGRTDPGNAFIGFTPMQWISQGSRAAKLGPDPRERNECQFGQQEWVDLPPRTTGPVYPHGLAFLLLLGVGSTALAIRRTRTPVRRLPNGTRIA